MTTLQIRTAPEQDRYGCWSCRAAIVGSINQVLADVTVTDDPFCDMDTDSGKTCLAVYNESTQSLRPGDRVSLEWAALL